VTVLVHLIPLGRDRYDLYAEPAVEAAEPMPHDAGRVRRWLHQAGEQWQRLVDAARVGGATGRFGRWRDQIICRLADSIDEQRTLWALRKVEAARALYPASLDQTMAQTRINQILLDAQRHHGWWFAIDLVLFIASGLLFFVPGPNVVAYYLGFRTFGHLQSWRGARQGASTVAWTLSPSDDLAELAGVAEQAHHLRAARVEAIAARLGLEHLPGFFERAAA
jgi:hypothetical protein